MGDKGGYPENCRAGDHPGQCALMNARESTDRVLVGPRFDGYRK